MWESLQGQGLVAAISCLTALSFMLIGYDNGVIGEIETHTHQARIFSLRLTIELDPPESQVVLPMLRLGTWSLILRQVAPCEWSRPVPVPSAR